MATDHPIRPTAEQRYWLVSPNVKNKESTVGEWSKASIRYRVTFMGWGPDDPKHISGLKFAGTQKPHIRGIIPGDRILIARRHCGKPQAVALGVVKGKYKRVLKGFKPPKNDASFGSLRNLAPFKRYSRPLPNILNDVLPRNRALTELDPDKDSARKKICNWIEQQLGKDGQVGSNSRAVTNLREKWSVKTPSIAIVDLPEKFQLDYKVQTERKAISAKRTEARLLDQYRLWLKERRQILLQVTYGRLRCDGYEVERKNLVEAKCSEKREYVRMAVGQLLDYSFQSRKLCRNPNMAILLPKKPDLNIKKWLRHLNIRLIWPVGKRFTDNANGKFL